MLDSKVILEAVLNREELTPIETLILLEEGEEIAQDLFEVADILTQRIHQNVVTYVSSRKIHYTNVCRAECKFCSFYRRSGERDAFALRPRAIVDRIGPPGGLRQIELSGGLNPQLPLTYHVEVLHTLREAFPHAHLHGYSPCEVAFLARRERTTPFDLLRQLRQAGLGSLSGDSAYILNEKLRKKIAGNALKGYEWIDILKTAHRMGLPTTATILFGHIEDEIHTSEHLEVIKAIQKATHGISAVTPIPFIPGGSCLGDSKRVQSIPPARILRMVAVCRLFFGRLVRTITVDWTKMGWPTVLAALSAGANDLGGITVDRHEIRSPDTNGRTALDPARLRAAVSKAGRLPMERRAFTMEALQRHAAWRPSWQQAQEAISI